MTTERTASSERAAADRAEANADRAEANADPADVAADRADPAPADHVPFRSVGFNLSSLGYAVARRFRASLAPLSLDPREFALLRAVAASEGQSQQAIGDRLQIPASKMVAFVDALEERGLLERRPNPEDRRARALHLTAAGRDLLEGAFALALGFERELCGDLSEADRERLLDLLQHIGAQLGLQPGSHAAHAEHERQAESEC